MGIQKIKSIFNLKNKPITYFATMFAALVVIALILNSMFLSNLYTDWITERGNIYFKSNINNQFNLKREVSITRTLSNNNEIVISTTFYDHKDNNGNFVVKNITINIVNEALIPILLVLIMILSLPYNWRRKITSSLIGFILINLYVFFKLYCFAYDNYSTPDYTLIKLPFLINKIVYYYNYFIELSGYSVNLVIAVIIFAISSIRAKDIELLNEHFQN